MNFVNKKITNYCVTLINLIGSINLRDAVIRSTKSSLAVVSLLSVVVQADNLIMQSGANMPDGNQIFSAEVVLMPASGRVIRDEQITAGNIKDFAPSPDAVEKARQFFASAGFNVGNVTGISFSITGPSPVFERVFNVKVAVGARGAACVVNQSGGSGIEFPLDAIPATIRSHVTSITFSQPLDFGPTGNFCQ